MSLLLNNAKAFTATTGTGTVTLGEAVSPYLTWATAGAVDGLTYSYRIDDANGAWEIGTGIYTASGTTLSRALVQSSTTSLLSLSGYAVVTCVPIALSSPLLFQEVITSGSQSSVTFSSIPAIGRDIEFRIRGRGTVAATVVDLYAQYNGDTGSNYVTEFIDAVNTSTGAANGGAETGVRVGLITGASAGNSLMAAYVGLIIGDYRGTTFYKSSYGVSSTQYGATTNTYLRTTGGHWNNTTAINSVKIYTTSGGFVDNSVISCYINP
jgi:hypothetical protein